MRFEYSNCIVVGSEGSDNSEVSEHSDNSDNSEGSDNSEVSDDSDNYSQQVAFSHLSTLHSSPKNAPLTTDHKKIK